MGSWSIGKKIGVTAAASGIVTAALVVTSFWIVGTLGRVIDSAYDADVHKTALVGAVDAELREMLSHEEALVSSVLQQNDAQVQAEKAEFAAAAARADKHLATLQPLLENADERADFDRLAAQVRDWAPLHTALVDHLAAGRTAEAVALQDSKLDAHVDAADAAVAELGAEFERTNLASNADADASVAASTAALVAFALIGFAALGTTLFVVHRATAVLRGVNAELLQGAEQVSSASSQVATASQSLSQGATEQAASLEETSATMEEMAAMTRRNAENSRTAAATMLETGELVTGANAALGEMVSSMAAIKESSDKVGRIIKTIDEIAFQTNILALNAAVEAARAGEAGMGFAVVADEVRALAQRAAQAAKDTSALIEESIARSTEGGVKVTQVQGAIASITDSTARVKTLIDEVSAASGQQAVGIDQVAGAVAQMEKVTQSTAATAEESAAASEELSAQAESSMDTALRLAVIVGGARAATASRAARAQASAIVRGDAGRRVRVKATIAPSRSVPTDDTAADTGTYGAF